MRLRPAKHCSRVSFFDFVRLQTRRIYSGLELKGGLVETAPSVFVRDCQQFCLALFPLSFEPPHCRGDARAVKHMQ
jgi:hypothetical protein